MTPFPMIASRGVAEMASARGVQIPIFIRAETEQTSRAQLASVRDLRFVMGHVMTQSPRYKWILVVVLFAVSALNYADRTALASVLSPLRQDLNLTDVQLGLAASAFFWVYALGIAVAGFIADRFSRSRLIVVSLTLWSLVTLATAYVHNFTELMLVRVALGAAECLYIPAALALIADHHGPDTRGGAISSNLAGMSLGLIVGGTVAGYLAQTWGWRSAFHLLGWLGLAGAVVVGFLVRDAEQLKSEVTVAPEKLSVRENLGLLLRTRTYYMILLQGILTSAGVQMFFSWLPLYYKETYGMSLAGAGFSGTFMLQGTALLGVTLGGIASDRVGRTAPPRRALIMAICYLASAPFLLVFLFQPSYLVLSIGISLFSLLRSFGQANENLILCDLLPSKIRSSALGIFLLCCNAPGTVSIIAAAWIKGHAGLNVAFAWVSVLLVISALAALVGYFWMPADQVRLEALARTAKADAGT